MVHVGTANAGHYYSYIRTPATGQWLQFNDDLVTPFDDSALEAQTFGDAPHNAFILFYDRVAHAPRVPPVHVTPGDQGHSGAGRFNAGTGAGAGAGAGSGAGAGGVVEPATGTTVAALGLSVAGGDCNLPPSLLREVAADNKDHWSQQNVFCTGYFSWVHSLLVSALPSRPAKYPDGGVATLDAALAWGGAGVDLARLGVFFVVHTLLKVGRRRLSVLRAVRCGVMRGCGCRQGNTCSLDGLRQCPTRCPAAL